MSVDTVNSVNELGVKFKSTGSEDVFTTIVNIFGGDLKSYIVRIAVPCKARLCDVDDIYTDTITKMYELTGKYFNPEAGDYSNWSYGVAKRETIKYGRLAKSRRSAESKYYFREIESNGEYIDFHSKYEVDQRKKFVTDSLRIIMADLPDSARDIIRYTYTDGMSVKEVSSQMGIPEQTVRYTLKKSLKKVKTNITELCPEITELRE